MTVARARLGAGEWVVREQSSVCLQRRAGKLRAQSLARAVNLTSNPARANVYPRPSPVERRGGRPDASDNLHASRSRCTHAPPLAAGQSPERLRGLTRARGARHASGHLSTVILDRRGSQARAGECCPRMCLHMSSDVRCCRRGRDPLTFPASLSNSVWCLLSARMLFFQGWGLAPGSRMQTEVCASQMLESGPWLPGDLGYYACPASGRTLHRRCCEACARGSCAHAASPTCNTGCAPVALTRATSRDLPRVLGRYPSAACVRSAA
jgi:hypothetical protein